MNSYMEGPGPSRAASSDDGSGVVNEDPSVVESVMDPAATKSGAGSEYGVTVGIAESCENDRKGVGDDVASVMDVIAPSNLGRDTGDCNGAVGAVGTTPLNARANMEAEVASACSTIDGGSGTQF